MGLPNWVNAGVVQLVTTGAAVPYPASLSTSNWLALVLTSDVTLAGVADPAGWTSLGSQVSGGGLFIRGWKRQAPASDPGAITFSGLTGGTTGIAEIFQYSPSGGGTITDVVAQFVADSDTSSTTFAGTGASWTLNTNDRYGVFMVSKAPSGAYSGAPTTPSLTSAGSTMGTSTQRQGASAATNTLRYLIRDVDVTAGGTGAPSWSTVTVGANAAGVMMLYKVTEVATSIPPTADAGPDQAVLAWDEIQLDGSGSSAAGGATITAYDWTPPAGVTLSDPTIVNPTALALPSNTPWATNPLVFSLVVTDSNALESTPNTVTVTVGSADCYMAAAGGTWKAVRQSIL